MRISYCSSDVCSSDLASFDKFIDPFTGADLSNQDFARVPKNNWRLTGSVDLIRSPDIGDVSFTAAYSGRNSYLDTDNAVVPFGVVPSHDQRSEEHTSELQSLLRISYAVFCLKKNNNSDHHIYTH